MSTSVAAFRPRRGIALPEPAEAYERRVRRRVGIAWGLLVFNVLTFAPGISVIPIPSMVGKAATQGSLILALLVALSANRRAVIRPNVFLCLVSLLAAEALMTSAQLQGFGTVYRTFRLAGFVATLWLLSPWWGRRDMLLARCHLAALSAIMGSVVLGLLVAPGRALGSGRLGDAIWPIPSTQLAHYMAIMIGLVTVLWFCGLLGGRVTSFAVVVAGAILILTHTRTALVGLIAGILVAGLSLIVAKARVRKLFVIAGVVAAIAIIGLSGVLTTWLVRGEGAQQLFDLSGRLPIWEEILNAPRTKFQEILGTGLSNSSFNGLAIDSNWLSSYQEQGLFGVIVCAMMLLFLLVTAYFQPRGVQRALALFLVTYCLIASFTEVGFTDASMYLLDLTVAASLLVPSAADGRPASLDRR
jgi:O-Antigen ligase